MIFDFVSVMIFPAAPPPRLTCDLTDEAGGHLNTTALFLPELPVKQSL